MMGSPHPLHRLTKEQVKTTQESLHLAKQRYRLGIGTVVEVTQSEIAVTAAQTRLAEALYRLHDCRGDARLFRGRTEPAGS
jgi:outer membrane protein TolC